MNKDNKCLVFKK
uniref:Uncharacterized protein n=1 Tax=Rhizophora mucronata TaxID=61149 RepID=A0A2P2NVB3_RHIMU